MYVACEFIEISHRNLETPVAVIRDKISDREIRVGVSIADASRISLYSFGIGKELQKELSQQIISASGCGVESIKFNPRAETALTVELTIKSDKKSFCVTPTPGEAVISSLENDIDILVHEDLFTPLQSEPSLSEYIRSKNVDSFGTVTIG